MKKAMWFFVICFLAGSFANAQVDLRNTGILFLSNNTDTVYINGNFTNTSTASFSNNGRMYIKQNLINDQSSMTSGTGTLLLNGGSAQAVNGTQGFKTFDLVTNNAAGITLNNNLSITGVHTFTSGMISTSATPNYMIYEAGSSYSGDGDSRHVIGWVKKNGSTNFVFPVGGATYERTTAISNLSVSAEIDCRYNTGTSNVFNLWSPLVQVRAYEYWQINKQSGGTARITLNWDHAKVPMDNVVIGDVLTAQYSAGNWMSTGGIASGIILGTGSVTSDPLAVFGSMTLGYKSFPVPLKLVSFDGERRDDNTYLHWVSENELNVDHFEVQKSFDARNFTVIGTVHARNSGNREEYDFVDRSALYGIVYYRLRSVDIDLKYSYSKVIAVSAYNKGTSLVVLNPSRNIITILNRTIHSGPFEYNLYNENGQLIIKGMTFMIPNGTAVITLTSPIAAGIYYIWLKNNTTGFKQKLLIAD